MLFDDEKGARPIVLSTHHRAQGQPVLAQVETYWRALRGNRHLPLRSDVDPAQIEAALPHAFILERTAPGTARMRVAGQALSGHLGADARGMPLSAFFTAAARPRLKGHLDAVFDGPAVVDLPVGVLRGPFRPRLSGRLLLLPLLGSDGEASRALGALVLDGAAGRGPRQFDIPADAPARCDRIAPPPDRLVAGLPHRPAASPARAERPWLRLVVSNP